MHQYHESLVFTLFVAVFTVAFYLTDSLSYYPLILSMCGVALGAHLAHQPADSRQSISPRRLWFGYALRAASAGALAAYGLYVIAKYWFPNL